MKRFLGLAVSTDILIIGGMLATPLAAEAEQLKVVYPPPEHQTVAEKIFFIGTASPQEPVLINGEEIENRSISGHFAPSLPLKVGENTFIIRQEDKKVELKITRLSDRPEPKQLVVPDSLTPAVDIARLPNELICLGAVATPNAQVSAQIGTSRVRLLPQAKSVLPANSAVLTSEAGTPQTQPNGQYQGCTTLNIPRNYGKPVFTIKRGAIAL